MTDRKRVQRLVFSERVCGGVALRSEPLLLVPLTKEVSLGGRREGITGGFQVYFLRKINLAFMSGLSRSCFTSATKDRLTQSWPWREVKAAFT